MTESSIFDPEHSQHPKPSMKNKPTAGRGSLVFNPLHPSMELPPEQLIRLLNMESKKTRKHMKMRRSPDQQNTRGAADERTSQGSPDQQKSRRVADERTSQSSPDQPKVRRVADEQKTHRSPSQASRKKTTDRQERPEPQQVGRQSHHMEYERNEPAVFDRRGPGWFLLALFIGLVTGVAVSGYLFWHQPSPAAKQKTPAPVVSNESRSQQTRKQQPQRQLVKRKAAPRSMETATLPAQAPVPAKAPRTGHDAKWQTAIKTEQNRLRNAAEQRLAEQLTKMKVSRELADLQAPPANDHTPAAAATLPAAAEPAFDQAIVSEPAPASAESPPTRQAPVEMIQADEAKPVPVSEPETLPTLTPAQAVGSDRRAETSDESTGLVDNFERDTVTEIVPSNGEDSTSDLAPAIEQDTVSDVTPSSAQETEAGQSTGAVSDESLSSASEDPELF